MVDKVFQFSAIGEVRSCFTEKFGIPRQPGLAPSAQAQISIYPQFARDEAFAGLDECSHIWVQFVFHATDAEWRPKVRPPRLGGNKSLGVFATRSPNRPNPLGLSVVSYLGITKNQDGFFINIGGVDLLNGTPVLDIKPYVPYADRLENAFNHLAASPPSLCSLSFAPAAEVFCQVYETQHPGSKLAQLVREVLQQDPRPQYQRLDESRVYGMCLLDLNIQWSYRETTGIPHIHVLNITTLSP